MTDLNSPILFKRAQDLAKQKGFDLEYLIINNQTHLALTSNQNLKPFSINWEQPVLINRLKQALNHGDPLLKIFSKIDFNQGYIIDATMGQGLDSLLLAARGYNLICFENNIIIYFLLKNALMRAQNSKIKIIQQSTQNILLHFGDITQQNTLFKTYPNISAIYLDPMFEKTQKKSAKPNKAMQIFSQIISQPHSPKDLLNWGILQLSQLSESRLNPKIIFKSPKKSEVYFANKRYKSVEGKSHRFDGYC